MDIEIKLPDIGIDQAEVIDILVKINDYVKKEQVLIIIEGDKASMEIPSMYEGKIKDIKVKITDIVQKDSIIMIMDIIEKTKISKNVIDNTNLVNLNNSNIIYASPLIRRLARSLDINLKNIFGSGRKNRIIKKDLDNYIMHNKKILIIVKYLNKIIS